MTVFDLLFLLLVLISLIALLCAAGAVLRGRRGSAWRILRMWGIGAAVYLSLVAVTGFFSPQRVLGIGDPWCFDDWCLTVEHAGSIPAPPQVNYTVSLRLSSTARRIRQRAAGAWIYLIDGQGNRYAPQPDPAATPLDVMLGPGESVMTSRTFKVPADAREVGLITGHGGPGRFPGIFIIGDQASLLHKPTFVRLR